MCGRYTYYSSKEIIDEYKLSPSPDLQLALTFPDNYNVAPSSLMPVIIRGEQEHIIVMMQWGLIPVWSKPNSKPLKLINARQEGLLEKPMWKRLVKSQRCIVPARGFYEWKTEDEIKQPYYITQKSGNALSFAGLWDEWTNEEGEKIRSYTIITTTPNKEMAYIHNRMPVILDTQKMDMWLAPTNIERELLDDLLAPASNDSLDTFRVSTAVNDIHNKGANLIYSLDDGSTHLPTI